MLKSIKKIALPPEHGSWGLTLEPLTLALIIAYSSQGLLIFFGAFFAFLAHQPARVLLSAKNEKRWASIFLILYGAPALVFFVLFLSHSTGRASLPLILALGLMLLYFMLEYFKLHRALFTEIMASIAMGLIALSIVLSSGWKWPQAWPFLILLYLRSLNTTLYVHYRLKLERRQPYSFYLAQGWQIITLLVALVLLGQRLIPTLAGISVIILSLRGIYGLSPWRSPLNVKQIGVREFIYGLQFVVLSALGYLL